jgi:hypothetical protein
VLGALEEAEHIALTVHLRAGCPHCAAALAEAQHLIAQLACLASPVSPPPRLRARMLAGAKSDPPPHPYT